MSTAQDRLQQGYYNSAAVSGANPGGLASGGHVPNFPAALADVGAVAQDVGAKAAATTAAAQSAGQSAQAASQDRVLAQQAAQAAGQFDPSTKVNKTGDTMSGTLSFGSGASYGVTVSPASEGRSGTVQIWNGTTRTGFLGYSNATHNFLSGDNGRGWFLSGGLSLDGFAPFTAANDGSGSGLDADLLRGLAPSVDALGNSLVSRNSAGISAFGGVYINGGGGVVFAELSTLSKRDANTLEWGLGLYIHGAVSASVVTERSDRRLKADIEPLEAVDGRLMPVRYVLKETGETRIGFIAQDIEDIRPEAVLEGALQDDAEEGAWVPLEVSHMALIAHLARQLNDLQDRLDKAGL